MAGGSSKSNERWTPEHDFAAQVVYIARQTRVRILGVNRFTGELLGALHALES